TVTVLEKVGALLLSLLLQRDSCDQCDQIGAAKYYLFKMLGSQTEGWDVSGRENENILASEIIEIQETLNLSVPKRLVNILEMNGISSMRLLAELC
ncbi:unnamed protein product, partial [Callosobruchus maculatus]